MTEPIVALLCTASNGCGALTNTNREGKELVPDSTLRDYKVLGTSGDEHYCTIQLGMEDIFNSDIHTYMYTYIHIYIQGQFGKF